MKPFVNIFILYFMALPAMAKVDVSIKHQAKAYYLNNGKPIPLKNGKFSLDDADQPVWVSAPGKVPLLLVPIDSTSLQVDIDSPELKKQFAKETNETIDRELSKVMIDIIEVQKSLARNNPSAARAKLAPLMKNHPELKFLNFLSASVNLLEGKKKQAMTDLQLGLEAHPDYADGEALLKRLKGAK